MHKDKIKKYDLLISDFNKHNRLYYNKSNPIGDKEFDELKLEILSLEKNIGI